jgi:IMP dehydrogenase
VDIDIGLGKSARWGYDLDDLSIVPSRRTRDADDVDTSWQLDAYSFDHPVALVGGDPTASKGGLVVVDAEGPDREIDLDAVVAGIGASNEAGVVSAVAIRPQRVEAALPRLMKAELDLLFIRGRVVSAEHVSRSQEPVNLKQVVRRLEVPVVVGGCASYQAALHLMRTGAAAVVVGVDVGSQGVGVPLATAIADARAARMRHLDETGVYVHLVATGALYSGGDIAKAIVCGADAVMLDAADVGACGLDTLVADLRRTMATCGYETLKEFQMADLVAIRR